MTQASTIRARIELVPTEDGGRRFPLFSGYRAGVFFGPDPSSGTDALVTIEGRDTCFPGEACVARIEFVHPELVQWVLAAERTFELKEGGRTVGKGTIAKLLSEDEID